MAKAKKKSEQVEAEVAEAEGSETVEITEILEISETEDVVSEAADVVDEKLVGPSSSARFGIDASEICELRNIKLPGSSDRGAAHISSVLLGPLRVS